MYHVLFGSNRPLVRAENLYAVYTRYDGDKDYAPLSDKSCKYYGGKFEVLVTDEFPTKSPGKVIMIGHGISGGKSYGLDQPGAYHKREAADLIDYVVCASPDTVSVVAKQSGVPESKVLPLGMPRTDNYIGKRKGDGGTFMAIKRSYLYAPTFRSRRDKPMPEIDFRLVDNLLRNNEVLVVKPHPITGSLLKGETFNRIIEVPCYRQTTPYLIDSDVVITDYSSIMFDAYVLNKPVILFDKDASYLNTRGMYYRYPDEYSGRFCTTEQELVEMARAAHDLTDIDLACKNRVARMCDGHSSERVITLIRSLL